MKKDNLISNLVAEYFADPNCWPELWIASEKLTPTEKQKFIESVQDKKKANKTPYPLG